jgi:hypothetical protein
MEARFMSKSIYLINPISDFPTYFSAESFAARGLRPAVFMADLAITTLAGLMGREGLEVKLCDENLSAVDFDTPADFIGITGKVTQRGRMAALAREFRRRGKVVLIGGPYASLAPDFLRPHCDILVRGEAEDILAELCSDMKSSRWKDEYVGGKPDLSHTALPRMEDYPNDRALLGTIQTSRGCPFECEFCDVIQYLGRAQRHKPIPQVLTELDQLYRLGYRGVFLADDNFTIMRAHAKELLAALRDWNCRQENGRVTFSTQVSIDAAKDDELLRMCADAGLTNVFVGIETTNEDSLRESKKRQNLRINIGDQVQKFLDHGIKVTGGMIVGFDSDDLGIFQRQHDFAASTAIPIFSIGALVAPEATPLHGRLEKDDRLVEGEEVAAMPWSTNIIPRQMTREQLLYGLQWLCNSLYHPAAFAERVSAFIDRFANLRTAAGANAGWLKAGRRSVDMDAMELISRVIANGPEEEKLFSALCSKAAKNQRAAEVLPSFFLQYAQIRYMYEQGGIWESERPSSVSPLGSGQTEAMTAQAGARSLPVLQSA